MNPIGMTPILNVSNMEASFAWFEKLGWKNLWDHGEPPSFGAVGSGQFEIFLSLNGQGGRGKGANTATFGDGGSESADKGVWLQIFVKNVDKVYELAQANGIEVVHPPEDMEWGQRECHIRHPDGHVFRISQEI